MWIYIKQNPRVCLQEQHGYKNDADNRRFIIKAELPLPLGLKQQIHTSDS